MTIKAKRAAPVKFRTFDGLTSVGNQLINQRNSAATNYFQHKKVSDSELRAINLTGIGSKIVRIKVGQALNDTLHFESEEDEETYCNRLERSVKQAAQFMVGFGRGIIVLHEPGAKLSTPLSRGFDLSTARLSVFSGDMVTVQSQVLDLEDPRYFKPSTYQVRMSQIHYSRVVDFTYVRPTEYDAAIYNYGGVSEFQLIYHQLVNDAVVERASAAIIERNSSFVYKIKGFKALLNSKKSDDAITWFGNVEALRSLYGAVLIDSEDDAMSVNQTMTNLSEVDQISLRRMAIVTGIPLALLVGEFKGLNANGSGELQAFQDTVEAFQFDYLLAPINELMAKCRLKPIEFKENQGETPSVRVAYEKTCIENAKLLYDMGEDYAAYLEEKQVIPEPDLAKAWLEPEEEEPTLATVPTVEPTVEPTVAPAPVTPDLRAMVGL